jgi:enoyl-ACP reductase-like protein
VGRAHRPPGRAGPPRGCVLRQPTREANCHRAGELARAGGGIGLETARRARTEGAADSDQLAQFFDELPTPIDHIIELAPIRVNLIAAGFVDTPLSASLLGDQLDARREELRSSLPIGRVVGPDDVANTALTGATYDIDGGQQLLPR